MSRHMFGWSHPPGAAGDPNAPWNQEDGPCEVCGLAVDDCVCPKCSCGEHGNPACYASAVNKTQGHGLKLTPQQIAARQRVRVARIRDDLQQEEAVLRQLDRHAKKNIYDGDSDYAEPSFSNDIGVNPNPWR